MERLKEYYCWIRFSPPIGGKLQDLTSALQITPLQSTPDKSSEAGLRDIENTNEDIAPKNSPGLPYDNSVELNGNLPPKLFVAQGTIFNAKLPPGIQYGGAHLAGWWGIDPKYPGPANFNANMMPIPGSRQDAIDWIGTDEGKTWATEANGYYFLAFFLTTGSWRELGGRGSP